MLKEEEVVEESMSTSTSTSIKTEKDEETGDIMDMDMDMATSAIPVTVTTPNNRTGTSSSPVVTPKSPATSGGPSIYAGMDDFEDDLGLSSISTTVDLYDDAVMGIIGEDICSQKTNDSDEDDDVFRPLTSDGNKDGGGGRGCDDSVRIRGNKNSQNQSQGEEQTGDEGFVGGSWEAQGQGQGGRRNSQNSGPRFALYVGNLTWWTSHEDLKKACKLVGAPDVQDIKIFECRANGQSKGYALVTFISEESLKVVTDQLDKAEIHGRIPVVKPDAKSSAIYFDSLAKTRPPAPTSTSSSGSIGAIGGSHLGGGGPEHSGYGGVATTRVSSGGSGNGPLMPTPYGGGNGSRYPPLRQPFHNNHHHRGYGVRGGGGGGLIPPPPRPWGNNHHFAPNSSPYHSHRYSPRMSNPLYNMPPRGPPPPLSSTGYGLHHHSQTNGSVGNSYDDWRGHQNYVPHRVHFNPAFLNRLPMFPPEDYNNTTSAMTEEEAGGGNGYYNPYGDSGQRGGPYSYTRSHAEYEYEDHHLSRSGPMSPDVLSGGIGGRPLSASDRLADEIAQSGDLGESGESSHPIKISTTSSRYEITSPMDGKGNENKDFVEDQSLTQPDVDVLLERNNSICSQAIQRAVTDASNGEYASSIETLVTAISLIRGSKVAKDKRCQVLVSSLQHSLEGIEFRSYGGRPKFERSLGQERDKLRARLSSPPKSGRSHYYYDRGDGRGCYSSQNGGLSSSLDSKDRISSSSSSSRRRTWEERGDDFVERDREASSHSRGSKTCRIEDGRDCYRR